MAGSLDSRAHFESKSGVRINGLRFEWIAVFLVTVEQRLCLSYFFFCWPGGM